MPIRPQLLLNTHDIEIWPAHLLRARGNAHARALARADHVLRRKRDGRFLAAVTEGQPVALHHGWRSEPGAVTALEALERARGPAPRGDLPLTRIEQRLHALGLDAEAYEERSGLALVAEPAALAFAGFDRYRRPLFLRLPAALAWRRLREAALREGIVLEPISGYRSHDYQLGIFERKLARGQRLDEILTVNAAPGYSEHHSGGALDISAPDQPAAEESFEHTPAFAWMKANAGSHGFVLSYPRDNPHGIVYEPWHWCYRPDESGGDVAGRRGWDAGGRRSASAGANAATTRPGNARREPESGDERVHAGRLQPCERFTAALGTEAKSAIRQR